MSPRFAFIVILAVMSAYLVFQAFSLRAVSSVSAPVAVHVTSTEKSSSVSSGLSLKEVAALNLMGKPYADNNGSKPAAKPQPEHLPATSLKLTLSAVINNTDQSKASAFIENEKRISKRYFVGDQVSAGVTIHAVEVDSVILSRNGQLETLRFPAVTSVANNVVHEPVVRQPVPTKGVASSSQVSQADYDENGKPSQSLRMRLKRMALEARRKKILERQGQQQSTQ